jgi:hypothetical protein
MERQQWKYNSTSTTFDSQDKAGLFCLKSTILLKNRTEGLITCSIYNKTTNQEKKRSIIISGKLLWLGFVKGQLF